MKQNKGTIIIGVTGGIGSGKSTVSRIMEELGAKIVDADVISREVVLPGEQALLELTQVFGEDILDDWGQLKRKHLAGLVFNDKHKLDVLNSIVHKYVAIRIENNVELYSAEQENTIIIDAPLPIKKGFLDLCDTVWVVSSSMEVRIERVIKRNGMTREEAIARINSQMQDDEYRAIADLVIYNDGDICTLKEEVKRQYNDARKNVR